MVYTYLGLQRSSVSALQLKFNAFSNHSHMEATLLAPNFKLLVSILKVESLVSYLNSLLFLYVPVLKCLATLHYAKSVGGTVDLFEPFPFHFAPSVISEVSMTESKPPSIFWSLYGFT